MRLTIRSCAAGLVLLSTPGDKCAGAPPGGAGSTRASAPPHESGPLVQGQEVRLVPALLIVEASWTAGEPEEPRPGRDALPAGPWSLLVRDAVSLYHQQEFAALVAWLRERRLVLAVRPLPWFRDTDGPRMKTASDLVREKTGEPLLDRHHILVTRNLTAAELACMTGYGAGSPLAETDASQLQCLWSFATSPWGGGAPARAESSPGARGLAVEARKVLLRWPPRHEGSSESSVSAVGFGRALPEPDDFGSASPRDRREVDRLAPRRRSGSQSFRCSSSLRSNAQDENREPPDHGCLPPAASSAATAGSLTHAGSM